MTAELFLLRLRLAVLGRSLIVYIVLVFFFINSAKIVIWNSLLAFCTLRWALRPISVQTVNMQFFRDLFHKACVQVIDEHLITLVSVIV